MLKAQFLIIPTSYVLQTSTFVSMSLAKVFKPGTHWPQAGACSCMHGFLKLLLLLKKSKVMLPLFNQLYSTIRTERFSFLEWACHASFEAYKEKNGEALASRL